MELPQKKDLPRVRKVSGELAPDIYLKLEMEAFQRGVSPYKLVSGVLTLYLSGKLKESRESSAPSPSPSVAGGISTSAD